MKHLNTDRLYDAIMGLAVGDALGVPYEFAKRGTFTATDMVGYGSHNQPVGTWSDDTSMTLATLESIKAYGKIDIYDMMLNFCDWYEDGVFTPHGKVFDIGITTRNAIDAYLNTSKLPDECGGKLITDNGNGSLMRILPLAFIKHSAEDIYKVSALTHAHEISMKACEIYVNIATGLLENKNKFEAVEDAFWASPMSELNRLDIIHLINEDDIRSSGYVVDTIEAACWCLLTTNTYKDCVLAAVNLGDDTDTTAAVAGGLAGIYYGVGGKAGIPEKWISKIVKKDYIKELCEWN